MRIASLAVLALAAACQTAEPFSTTEDQLDLNGTYAYSAWDQAGRLAVVGTLTLTVADDSSISGTKDLFWAPGADTTAVVGPQVGLGPVEGMVFVDLTEPPFLFWAVDLNPGWADNNAYAGGPLPMRSGRTTRWSHSTFVGPIADGRLKLERLTR